MKFIPMTDLLHDAARNNYAIPSFCVWNAETMKVVLRVAEDLRAPVIVMNGPCEFGVLDPTLMGAVAHAMAAQFRGPAALHLDHGDSIDRVKTCLDAGYTSVMLDYSSRSFAENVAALRQVVALARTRGVTVEGELGHVGKADTMTVEGTGDSTLTEVADAVAYVAQTGVDALAVSIGNAHGQYAKLPTFDFARLEKIHSAIRVPLVLHGGSGTPRDDLRRAIALGMAKINVATELVTAWRESLYKQWSAKQNMWAPQAMVEAEQALVPVIQKWIRLAGAEGRA